MQNTFVESFNVSFRDELLNHTIFLPLAEAREKITTWKDDYNRPRPHGICFEIETGNQCRLRPETNRRTRPEHWREDGSQVILVAP